MLVCVGFEAAGKCMEYVANRQTIENELTAWDKGRAYNYSWVSVYYTLVQVSRVWWVHLRGK